MNIEPIFNLHVNLNLSYQAYVAHSIYCTKIMFTNRKNIIYIYKNKNLKTKGLTFYDLCSNVPDVNVFCGHGHRGIYGGDPYDHVTFCDFYHLVIYR